MTNTILQVSIVFIITGYILTFISIMINVNLSLVTSLILQFVGLSGISFESYNNNNYYILISSLILMFILIFNIYISFKYDEKITKKRVPEIYYSFSFANILLVLLETAIIVHGLLKNSFNISTMSIVTFLLTFNFIILTTISVILKDYSTDG